MNVQKNLVRTVASTALVLAANASYADFMVMFDQQSAFEFDNVNGPTPLGAAIGFHNAIGDGVDDRVDGVESIWWDAGARGQESEQSPIDTTDLLNPLAPDVTVDGVSVGENDATSALKVVGLSDTLSIPENGDFSAPAILSYTYHRNNALVSGAPTPDGGSILSSTLFSLNGDSEEDENTVEFDFNETFNGAPCAPPNPVGTTCDDIFTFQLASFAPTFIELDGTLFEFEFALAPQVGAQVFPGPGLGELSLYTGEEQISFVAVTVQGRVAPVPAPATLSILGLGLLALGRAARRNRAKS